MSVKETISPNKMELYINVADELGTRKLDRDIVEAYGQAVIDAIVERTQDGKSLNGSKFRRYTKEYADFKGVSRDDVDLTLTSDMLESLAVVKSTANTVTIGFVGDQDGKAHGNHTGKDGAVPKMRRPFFGVQKQELKDINSEFKRKEEPEIDQETLQEVRDLATLLAKGLFDFGR